MSDDDLNFDATEVDPASSFEPIPAGKYKAQIVASEIRPTKDGTNKYLWLELEILDGEYAGRKVWDRLSLWHDNQQAQEIAKRTLSAICHATGKLRIKMAEELHDLPLIVSVKVRPPQNGFEANNEVRAYAAADDGAKKAVGRSLAPAPKAGRAGPWDED